MTTLIITLLSLLYSYIYAENDTRLEGGKGFFETSFIQRELSKNNTKNFMIVGGSPAEYNRYKYHCNLLRRMNNGSFKHSCGCTLIAPNVVLTAAHCTGDSVQIGKFFFEKSENEKYGISIESFLIIDQKVHPSWDRSNFQFDVMIMLLAGESSQTPVKLRFSKQRRRRDDVYTVLGFGAMDYESPNVFSNILQEVQVNYMNNGECSEYYEGYITKCMVCAYSPGKDACVGDSGGPMIFKGSSAEEDVQIGITSWGYRCGVYPGVYTYLPNKDVKKFLHQGVCNIYNGFSPNSASCKDGLLSNVV